MRRVLCLLLAVAIAQPALAAQSVTVDELEQLLVLLKAKSDGAAAKRLSELELTERASSARLERWEEEFPAKHSHSREALTALADASAFLELPAADVPSGAPPDRATQREILSEAAAKVSKALTQFPNFYATRSTTHFEDTLPHQEVRQEAQSSRGRRSMGMGGVDYSETSYEPLHRTAKTSVIVTYRDGNEVPTTQTGKKPGRAVTGLTTNGEFGPILVVVIGDALRNDVRWSHWEQGANGPLVVFKYAVPEEKSNFMVRFPNGATSDDLFPAYHGEIAVDPASGDIFRLTEVADFKAPRDDVQTALLVEYAPVEIGERVYICPVRGVALSKLPDAVGHGSEQASERAGLSTEANAPTLQTHLNDVAFTQYHLFRANIRILPEESAQ